MSQVKAKVKAKDSIKDDDDSKIEEEVINTKDENTGNYVKPKVYPTCFGYFTQHGIKIWIAAHPKEYQANKQVVTQLEYDADPSKPLYFWQLFSLLGYDRIRGAISVFYNSIFKDKNAKKRWFRRSFSKIGSLEHHIKTQTQFWCDAFGGK